jgi:hypothetical protein
VPRQSLDAFEDLPKNSRRQVALGQARLVDPETVAGEARPMSAFFALLDPLLRQAEAASYEMIGV